MNYDKQPNSVSIRREHQSVLGYLRRQTWTDPILADDDRLKLNQASSNSAVTTITTFLAQPDFPRNITITPGGTTASVPAANVTVTGTNIRDEVITEDILLTENGSSLVSGTKAFKTVTSIVLPIQDGTGATYKIGVGDVLGLDRCMTANNVLQTTQNGSIDSAATVTFDADEVEKNTINPNASLDGSVDFGVLFFTSEITSKAGTTA